MSSAPPPGSPSEEIVRMAGEHWTVFEALLTDDVDAAASALEAHLRRSVDHNIEVLRQLPLLPEDALPSYLVPIKLHEPAN